MSKMSQLHAELSQQAYDLGFESIQDAEDHGYEVISDGKWAELVKSETDEEEAHKAWLKERDEVLGGLANLMVHSVYDYDTVIKAYNFIKEQCHD